MQISYVELELHLLQIDEIILTITTSPSHGLNPNNDIYKTLHGCRQKYHH